MTDNLNKRQRSYCMSRIKSRDTALETMIRGALFKRGLRFHKHVKELPGKPDIVFPRAKLAVFLDGDFWHGYRFPSWRKTVPPFWRTKIDMNRRRDQRNFAKLRRKGWLVMRIWQHQVTHDMQGCVEKIVATCRSRMAD